MKALQERFRQREVRSRSGTIRNEHSTPLSSTVLSLAYNEPPKTWVLLPPMHCQQSSLQLPRRDMSEYPAVTPRILSHPAVTYDLCGNPARQVRWYMRLNLLFVRPPWFFLAGVGWGKATKGWSRTWIAWRVFGDTGVNPLSI